MATFTVERFRFENLTHVRVRGEDFPRLDSGAISEWFEVDCFLNGQPLDLYPNHDPHPHPDSPNHLTIGWVGRETVPVYDDEGLRQVGEKRGADFRTRFWPAILRRCLKAEAGAEQGKRIGDVLDSDLRNAPKPPVLSVQSIDEAVLTLTGAAVQISRRIPPGSIANIDCDFDSEALDGTSENETGTTVAHGRASGTRRSQFRFPLASISSATAINDVDIQYNILSTNLDLGDSTEIRDYNNTGASDPDTDTAADKYARSINGSILATVAANTTGSKTADLGATADTEVAANLSSPGFWAAGFQAVGTIGVSDSANVEAIENAGTDPATLTVDYTAPATTLQDIIGGLGIVPFAR